MSMKNLICLTLCYSKKLAILTGVFSLCKIWKTSEVFLRFLQNSQESACTKVTFLIKLQAEDSGTGVFLWILQNFYEHLFHRNTLLTRKERRQHQKILSNYGKNSWNCRPWKELTGQSLLAEVLHFYIFVGAFCIVVLA